MLTAHIKAPSQTCASCKQTLEIVHDGELGCLSSHTKIKKKKKKKKRLCFLPSFQAGDLFLPIGPRHDRRRWHLPLFPSCENWTIYVPILQGRDTFSQESANPMPGPTNHLGERGNFSSVHRQIGARGTPTSSISVREKG